MTIRLEAEVGPDAHKLISLLERIAYGLSQASAKEISAESREKESQPVKKAPMFLGEKELANELGVSVSSLRRWRLIRTGPVFVKAGGLVRYRRVDVEEWIKTCNGHK